jgi:uncharacterized Ntn-hydrolase superfamily protein
MTTWKSEERFGRPVHTFSIMARDEKTGMLGVAVQSHWFSVGADVGWAEAGVGVVATQSFAEPAYGPKGLELMRQGKSASEALEELVAADPGEAVRQVAMVDVKGRVAVHTGKRCVEYAGHKTGLGYSVQANLMLNDTVPSAMSKAFEKARGGLADRLMAALDAAQKAGGDIRGKQSASMLVVKAEGSGKPWADRVIDLRVDDHPEPLRELRRLLNVARSYEHANAGDLAMEKNDFERAMKEYRVAMKLAGGNVEIAFWSALTLASKGKVDHALPMFRKVFSADKNWVQVLKRLPKAGTIISDDHAGREMLKRILQGTGQTW